MNKDLSSYFESEEFKELLSQYEESKKNDLTLYFDSDQLTDISDYYSTQGKYKKAFETVEYALHLHPESTDAMVVKAHLLLESNNLDEARKVIEAIKDNSDYEVKLLKAELLLVEGKESEVANIFSNYIAEEESNKECYLDIAFLYLNNEHPKIALTWFQKALSLFPDDIEITEGIAESYFEAGIPQKAIEYYNILLDENPYSVDYWIELGKIYFTIENYNKAIEAYEFAVTIDPKNRHAYLMMGHCYTKLENFPKAEENYKAFSSENNQDGSHYYLGICYASMGEYEKAIDSFLKGIKADGELFFEPIDIYSYISECYNELGNKEEAIRYIDLAINEDLECVDPQYSKARLLLKFGETHEALEQFYHLTKQFSLEVSVIMEIGIIFTEHKRYEWALSTFALLEIIYPLAYHLFASFLYKRIDNIEMYQKHLDEMLKLNTSDFLEKVKYGSEKEDITQIKNILIDLYENHK